MFALQVTVETFEGRLQQLGAALKNLVVYGRRASDPTEAACLGNSQPQDTHHVRVVGMEIQPGVGVVVSGLVAVLHTFVLDMAQKMATRVLRYRRT